MMPAWLAVGLGGFVGAVARYQITLWLSDWSRSRLGQIYPVGTFAVNILGCLLIGLLMTLFLERRMSADAQRLLISGFLGSLTTFSAFGFDTIGLFREDKPVLAGVYVLASVGLGLGGVLIGIGLGRLLIR